MDQHMTAIVRQRIERAVLAFHHNGFDAHFIKDTGELLSAIPSYIPDGGSWSVGGSITLFETGVIDFLKSKNYIYYDRYAQGADTDEVFRQAGNCDCYFMSSNAITENGELYNVDGNGNRISSLIYGPKKVVVIVGYNKLVKDIEGARQRVWEIAAPANALRLNNPDLYSMCSHELVSRAQSVKKRIAVLILPQSYGY